MTTKAAQVELKVTTFSNEEALLQRINPDLYRIYRAMKVINSFGGHGSFEVHLRNGKIKDMNGLYIKPSFDIVDFDKKIKEIEQ